MIHLLVFRKFPVYIIILKVTSSLQNHQEELSSTNHVNANSKGSRVVTEGESPVVIRPRRQSAPWVGPPEVPYPNWDHMVGSSRPISPAAVVTVGLLQQSKGNTRHGSLGLDFDEAYISEVQKSTYNHRI